MSQLVIRLCALAALALLAGCGARGETNRPDLRADHPITRWVQQRFDRITAQAPTVLKQAKLSAPREKMTYTLHVVDDPDRPLAYAKIDGHIYISTGMLLTRIRNCDELAAVLAHEVGHVLLAHPKKKYTPTKSADGVVKEAVANLEKTREKAIADGKTPERSATPEETKALTVIFAGIFAVGEPTFGSRMDEDNTDRLAVMLLRAAGLPPEALAGFLHRNASEVGACPDPFYATHPPSTERAGAVRVTIGAMKQEFPKTGAAVACDTAGEDFSEIQRQIRYPETPR